MAKKSSKPIISKRIIYLAIIAVLIIEGTYLLVNYNEGVKTKIEVQNNQPVVSKIEVGQEEMKKNIDTDEDGLMDWEEELYGTDPINPDSDGDSTSDGDEISKGRDPLKKGPNDKKIQNLNASSTNSTKNTTDKFAVEFFSQYMLLSQSGLSSDADVQKKMVGDLLSNQNLELKDKYVEKYFNTIPDTPANLKYYGNKIAELYLGALNSVKDSPINIDSKITPDNSSALWKQFGLYSTAYKNLIANITKITPPKSLLRYHVELLNALNMSLENMNNLMATEKDPMLSIQSLERQKITGKLELEVISKIFSNIKKQGVTFIPGDKAFILKDY